MPGHLEEAIRAVDGFVLLEQNHPDPVEEPLGAVLPRQLPLRAGIGGQSMLKAFVDVALQCTLQDDRETMEVALAEQKWNELPVPLCTKVPLPERVRMQLAVVPRAAQNEYTVSLP